MKQNRSNYQYGETGPDAGMPHSSTERQPVVLMIEPSGAIGAMLDVCLKLSGYTSVRVATSSEAMRWLTSTDCDLYEPAVILFDLPDQAAHLFLSFLQTCTPSFRSLLIQILNPSSSKKQGCDVHFLLPKPFAIRDLLFYVSMAFPQTHLSGFQACDLAITETFAT